jgi:hypothetical protein
MSETSIIISIKALRPCQKSLLRWSKIVEQKLSPFDSMRKKSQSNKGKTTFWTKKERKSVENHKRRTE